MIVFQKGCGSTSKINFIDLNEKLLCEATADQLKDKNYSLNYKQYLAQSISEIEGFEMVKLGDIIELETGTYITKKTCEEGPYPVYGGGGISSYIAQHNRENKFVIAKDGVSDICARFVHGKFFLNHHGWTFHTTKENTNYQYVGHWLLNNQSSIYALAVGTAQKGINQEAFLSLEIPLPSLERQQQIVEAIDGWAQLAQHEEVGLKLLEKQVMLQVKDMGRGNACVKLGSIADFTFGYVIKSEDFGDSGLPIIKTKNFQNGSVSLLTGNPRTEKKYDEKYCIKHGDLLMVVDGACGESAIWRESENGWLNQHVAKLHIENVITRMYVAFIMKTESFKDYIQSNVVITTIPHMQRDVAKNFEIPLPPITEQQKLQSDFDEIQRKYAKIAIYKAKAQDAINKLIPN
jgi:restriction endonuclease S subunit